MGKTSCVPHHGYAVGKASSSLSHGICKLMRAEDCRFEVAMVVPR